MLSNGNSHLMQLGMGIKQFDSSGSLIKEIHYPSKKHNNSSIEIKIHNKDGTLADCFKVPFHSFNRNFAIGIFMALQQAQSNTITETDGSSYNPNQFYLWGAHSADSPAGNSLYGIIPGTGSSAVSSSDYKLEYQVPHGTGDNELDYQLTTPETTADYIGDSYGFSLTRQFINQGSTTITIREVEVYGNLWGATSYVMLCRDRLDFDDVDINVNVGAGQTLTIRQNFYIDNTDGMTKYFIDYLAGTLGAQTVTMNGWTYPEGFPDEQNFALAVNYSGCWLFTKANAGIHRAGIAVGSDASVTSSLANNSLSKFIFHGDGSTSGSLTYALQEYDAIADSGSYFSLNLKRTFTNNTESDITIREAALYVCGNIGSTGGMTQNNADLDSVLIARKLTGDITISPTAATEITFTVTIPTE